MLGTDLSISHALTHLILTMILKEEYYYYPHFMCEKTKAQRSDLPKVIQLVNDRAETWTEATWLKSTLNVCGRRKVPGLILQPTPHGLRYLDPWVLITNRHQAPHICTPGRVATEWPPARGNLHPLGHPDDPCGLPARSTHAPNRWLNKSIDRNGSRGAIHPIQFERRRLEES